MIEKIIKYKKYIISIVLILLLSLFFLNMKYLLPKKYKEIPEVKLREIKNSKTFAIMIQNGEEYEEYSSNKWPDENYQFKEAKCVNDNGALVDNAITFENGKATLKINQTIYCTLYFDKSTLGKLRDNEISANKHNLSSDIQGGMYRYQGNNNDEIYNYICFGTANKNDCINEETGYDKYMYRIIGITKEEKLYIIKMKGVEEENKKTFAWNSKYDSSSDCLGDACEWPNSDIYKRLNGEASNGNPIFINNVRYEYMEENNLWYKKIEKHDWMYGDVYNAASTSTLNDETIYGAINNGLILYDIETGAKPTLTYDYSQSKYVKHQWSTKKIASAKIGLMYLHDYYLAYDSERDWSYKANTLDTNNWLFIENNYNTTGDSSEWLISRIGGHSNMVHGAWRICDSGFVCANGLQYSRVIRPTFYILPTIKIKSGTGSISNPFILEV